MRPGWSGRCWRAAPGRAPSPACGPTGPGSPSRRRPSRCAIPLARSTGSWSSPAGPPGAPSPREHDRIGLLERIGERLAGSLELNVTLRHVAETLVPQFADHCFIDLLHGDKLIRRAQSNARGWTPPPGSWAQVGEQVYYPDGHFCQQAMAQLDAVVVPDLRDRRFPAPNTRSLRAREEVGVVSAVAAPLCARGELLGVMSLGLSRLSGPGERHYDADDRGFMAAIAGRVAIAIDNAMLFEEERRTALAFQTSLLPQRLPTLDGLEVAWRYMPAKPLETHGQGIQTQVGGDWYDLIPLSAGRVGIVIGDVEGRGARAAAVMGQLRAALRAFAQDDKPPAEIMRKLDDWCRTLGTVTPDSPGQLDPPMASCTYLVYDAWSRTLSFSNAGHEAPLLITGGEVGELEIEHKGVLLGVRGGIPGLPTYREEVRQLPPGSTLVFYTDGLTDRRQRLDGTGHYTEAEAVEMLRSAVHAVAGADVEAIAQAAMEAVPGEIDDDMAIVVVRTSRSDLASWECAFPAEPIRVSEARRQARAVLIRWGVPAKQAELACLLVSEVVTNVVLHTTLPVRRPRRIALEPTGAMPRAGVPPPVWEKEALRVAPPPPPKQFTLRLRRGAAAVWVEVFDTDLRLPRIRSADETDEGGPGAVPGGPDRQPLGVAADQERQGGLVRDAYHADGRRLKRPAAAHRAADHRCMEYPHRASTPTMNTAMTISQVRPPVVPMPARRRSLDQLNATSSARNTSRISPGSIGFLPLARVPRRGGDFLLRA